MVKKPPTHKTGENAPDEGKPASSAVKAIKDITAATRGSVPAQVVGVFGVIVVVVGLALIPGGNPGLAVVVVAIGALLMAVAMVVGLLSQRGTAPAQPDIETPIGEMRWFRMVLSQTRVASHRFDLNEALRSIRRNAQEEYRSILAKRKPKPQSVDVERVRINVFLPDTDAGETNLQVCELYVPDQLSDGMSHAREREIRFWPGQGLTGLVFVSGRAFGATWAGDQEPWARVFVAGTPGTDQYGEEIFNLTKDQVNRINPLLRWIIGFPLLVANQVVGVLNIDGLVEKLDEEEMRSLYSSVRDAVDAFAARLNEMDLIKRVIEVWVREPENDRVTSLRRQG